MKKVLYLGLPYHKKTKSNLFVLELLKEKFQVEEIYHDFYANESVDISLDMEYDYLVCWQVMPSREFLKMVQYHKAIFFPMYDGVVNIKRSKWMEYSDFIIICFSKKLYDTVNAYGIKAHYIQYFPKPISFTEWGNEKSLFFWQRVHEINVNTLAEVTRSLELERIHIHKALDPQWLYIPPHKKEHLSYTSTTWFEKKEDMYQMMLEAALFAAPRRYEGIGMSFLEAMSMGRCVIAPDCPTMNEYIVNGETGILYNIDNPQPVSKYDVVNIQRNAYQYICEGYQKWEREKIKIIEWIETSNPNEYREENDGEKVVKETIPALVRANSYNKLLNNWLKIKNRNLDIGWLLEQNDIHRIAIYGYSQIAERLLEELESSSVDVNYIIDRNRNLHVDGRRIVSFDDEWEPVEAIIITPVHVKGKIMEDINAKGNWRAYSLDRIIDALLHI